MPAQNIFAAGVITGTVFRDLNANGNFDNATEPGVGGVIITAYDATGVKQGSTSSAANGIYTLSATGIGPYRIEFTNLPANLKPGPAGSQSGTTVQFVAGNSANNINLGINNPAEYCQNNPNIAANCFIAGDPLKAPPPGFIATGPAEALSYFPYHASGETNQSTALADAATIGAATWGLAYQRTSKTLFVAAVQRRHSGYGPLGSGGIYAVDMAGVTPAVTNFANLNTVAGINTGSDPHSGLPGCQQEGNECKSIDPASFDAVGKVAFGDIELSEDEQTLWAVNLNQRTLLAIQVGAPLHTPTTSDVTAYPLINHGAPNCTNGEFRPWGLKVHNGLVYVGGVCSAEHNGTAADLDAYVLSFDPNQPAAGFSTVTKLDLDYAKGCAWQQGQPGAYGCQWNPWLSAWPTVFPGQGGDNLAWPQPILSDIEFDVDGSLILGFGDRWFLQGGEPQPPANASDPVSHVVHVLNAGDILRVCNVNGAFVQPGAAGCANKSNNHQGPGNGEFYFEDDAPTGYTQTGENSQGGLAFLPGSGEVATTAIEPFQNNDDAGVIWHNNNSGARNRGYTVYHSAETHVKAMGMGDIELLCDAAPIEIGNRVWQDGNSNGLQDPGEAGLGGVTVDLYRNNVKVGTTITSQDGQYYFNNSNVNLNNAKGIVYGTGVPNGSSEYTIRIPNATGIGQQLPLAGLQLTEANDATPSPSGSDLNDSDGVVNGVDVVYTVPYTDLSGAGYNNHTYDFGFITLPLVNLGNLVWHDANHDGHKDANENGIDGIELQLFNAGANPLTSPPLRTTTTSNGGLYNFINLTPGNYFVYIPTPPTLYPQSSAVTDGNDDGTDNDDNGVQTGSGNPVTSPVINLAVDAEPDIAIDGNDRNGDLTVDFGFYGTVQVGDYVWIDANHDGQQDAGSAGNEPGVPGIKVTLFNTATDLPVTLDASNQPITPQITDSGGKYLFSNLPAGDYYVVFDLKTLPTGYGVTRQQANGVPADSNSDADPITGKSTATGLLQNGSNLTLDMGIYTPQNPVSDIVRVGDFVWEDLNANGLQDAGEPGIGGVKATLFQSTGAAMNLVTTTAPNGFYLFDNLPPGNYYVVFDLTTAPAGYGVTTKNAGGDRTLDSDADQQTGQTAPTGPLTAGSQDLTLDLGLFKPASLGDYVWIDQNSDGVQDNGEIPVANVLVTLFDGQANQVATTVTDATGFYHFSNLRPGDYYVVFTQPAGYTFTRANQGGNLAKDSDANQLTGRTVVTTLSSGEDDLTWDAGLTPALTAALGGHVWDDGLVDHADGEWATNENLLNGVMAVLLDASGQEISHTLTAADGSYLFENLAPGHYQVTFVLAPGYAGFTINHAGEHNSDANPITGQTVLITLNPGQRDLTWDAGFVSQPTDIENGQEPSARQHLFLPLVTR
ncbi:MAG: carboxypeptidase regulatory-like domain-containing protein [Chloroflexi bacterium]|nr:carboxypeptidase regulatory-like domain-containing protein [Chloroflexota bacterium]